MSIRVADKSDIQTIAALHTISWQTAYCGILSNDYLTDKIVSERLAVWIDKLTNPTANQITFLYEIEAEAQGFVCAIANKSPQYGTYIDNLHVVPHLKGKGIGKILMQKVADWSKQTYNQPNLYLTVLEENYPAIGFYEKIGGILAQSFIEKMPSNESKKVRLYTWHSLNLTNRQ